ncbi:MAG: hypothetical protein ACRC62_08545 [Microcoleus sp.]
MYLKIEYGSKESPIVATAKVKSTWQNSQCSRIELEMLGGLALVTLLDGLTEGVAHLALDDQTFIVYSVEPMPSIETEVLSILSRWFEEPAQPMNIKPVLREPVTTGWD